MTASAEINPRRRRIAVYKDDPISYPFPLYMASLIVSEDPKELVKDPSHVAAAARNHGTATVNIYDYVHRTPNKQAKSPALSFMQSRPVLGPGRKPFPVGRERQVTGVGS
jgi:hypothetical protein